MNNVPCDDVAAFLLGELTDDEVLSFKEHMKHCQQCQEDVRDLMPANETLLGVEESGTDMQLSKDLKEKTLDRAFSVRKPNEVPTDTQRVTSKRRLRLFPLVSSVAILIIGMFIGRFTDSLFISKSIDSPAEMVKEVSLTPVDNDRKSVGMAMVYKQGEQTNLVLYVKNMQSLGNWGCYSVWITENNKQHNLGDFTVDRQGDAVLSVQLPNPIAATTLQITREPTWNDVSPEGPRVLSTQA